MNVMSINPTSCSRVSDKSVYENGELIDSNIQMGNYTTYPSAFLVVDPDGIFSKHYYAGTQRIAARLGNQKADELFMDKKKPAGEQQGEGEGKSMDDIKLLQQQDLQQYLDKAEITARLSFKEYKPDNKEQTQELPPSEGAGYGTMAEDLIYYYHPDHLGTATYLTDINGLPYEFFLNLPFGETMAEQHSQTGDYSNRWKFTGHELDRETGLYYAGARYYDPKVSIWLSVDPLAEDFPDWNPYHYVHQNPINLIDPSGMSADSPDNEYRVYKKGGEIQRIEYVSDKGGDQIDFITEVNLDKLSIDSSAYNSFFIPVEKETIGYTVNDQNQIGFSNETERGPGYKIDYQLVLGQDAIQPAGGIGDPIGLREVGAMALGGFTTEVTGSSTLGSAIGIIGNKGKSSSSLGATQKLSKVGKSKTVQSIGGKYTKTTEVRPGMGPGQSRAEYIRYKNEGGKVVKNVKDSYDRAGKFQHRKVKELPK